MSSLPSSQKTLRKFFLAISILLGLALGMWISLYFATQMEQLHEVTLVYKFWYGVYLASRFISILLAACWVVLLVMRLVVAIRDEISTKPKPGDPNWRIDAGDLSDFD